MSIRRLNRAGAFSALAGLMSGIAWTGVAMAQEAVGKPTDGAIGLQPAASVLKHDAIYFHNWIVMPVLTVIVLLVLALLIYVAVRFNEKANPKPATFSHNTAIEVIWTLVPVLILVFISVFSFRLLFKYHDMPKPDLTIKAVGYQWYWGYDYPDNGIEGYEQRYLSEADAKKAGEPYLLAVDNPIVVPVNKVVRLQVTANDVIHAFALPAFGLKTDAIPGRLNETWFKADRVGKFYGQCSELCGVDHAYMPIQINVVTQAEYEAWLVKQGGKTDAMVAAEKAKADAEAKAAEAAAKLAAEAAAAQAAAAPATPAATDAAAPAATTQQQPAPAAAPVAAPAAAQ